MGGGGVGEGSGEREEGERGGEGSGEREEGERGGKEKVGKGVGEEKSKKKNLRRGRGTEACTHILTSSSPPWGSSCRLPGCG